MKQNAQSEEVVLEEDTEPGVVQTTGDTADTDSAEGVEQSEESPLAVEVAELNQKLEENKQQLLRVQADFDNFRRRTRQEKEELQKYATKKLLVDLLPVVDNFDRALASTSSAEGQDELLAGVDMVRRQLLNVLEQHGVEPMECVGQPFDPNHHEAVMQEPAGDEGAGVVVAELQRGYWLTGKVLRPAMVKVTV